MPQPVIRNTSAAAPPSAAEVQPVSSRAILAGRGFRRLLAIRLTSQVADGWFQAGIAGSILFSPQSQKNPLAIATGFAIMLLPYSLLGPYVGVLLDRWDRRGSLSVANLARAVIVLPTAALLWAGAEGALFALCALLVIAINRFFLAGLAAALPRVVDDEKLVPANALATTLGTMCYSFGLFTSAAVVVMHWLSNSNHGYGLMTGVAALGYLVSGLLGRYLFKFEELGPLEHERHTGRLRTAVVEVGQGMVAGTRHLLSRRKAAFAIGLQGLYRVLFGTLTLAGLLLFSRYFGQPDKAARTIGQLALVAVAGAAGAAVAALITPWAVKHLGAQRWLVGLVASVGVVVLVLGLPFNKVLLLISSFLINVASQSMKIIVDSTIQHECEDVFRGRIFSVNDTVFNLCFVVGLFIASLTLPDNGKSAAALICVSVGFVVLAGVYAYTRRRFVPATPVPPSLP